MCHDIIIFDNFLKRVMSLYIEDVFLGIIWQNLIKRNNVLGNKIKLLFRINILCEIYIASLLYFINKILEDLMEILYGILCLRLCNIRLKIK